MDIELKHLGQTLAVGGVAVYAALLLIRSCRADWVPQFFAQKSGEQQIQHGAVYLAIIFAVGVVLEDVSKNYAAKRSSFLSEIIGFVLDSDRELRLRSLFEVKRFSDEWGGWVKPKKIFSELDTVVPQNQAVEAHLNTLGRLVPGYSSRTFIEPHQTKVFQDAVNGVFYDAKALDYRNENYFIELSEIADRMDFTRSLVLLCLLFGPLYLSFSVLTLNPAISKMLDIDAEERRTIFILSLAFFVGLWASRIAYVSESSNYDLRVFGYYISQLSPPSSVK